MRTANYVATIILVCSLPIAAVAAPARIVPTPTPGGGTTFDLGVDVSGVMPTAGDVSAYLAGLPPETQSAIIGACGTYLGSPVDARSAETLPFCEAAIGSVSASAGSVRAFGSAAPALVAPPAAQPMPITPAYGNTASGNTYRVFPNDSAKGSF